MISKRLFGSRTLSHLMAKTAQEFIKIDYKRKIAIIRINVAGFLDNGHQVAYIPSLKLSAYGPNKSEAMKMLVEEVVKDLFDNLFKLTESELGNELAKYGWQRRKIFTKEFRNSMAYVDASGILRDFNLPEDTKVTIEAIDKTQKVAA